MTGSEVAHLRQQISSEVVEEIDSEQVISSSLSVVLTPVRQFGISYLNK